jgi:hypothetical protein
MNPWLGSERGILTDYVDALHTDHHFWIWGRLFPTLHYAMVAARRGR